MLLHLTATYWDSSTPTSIAIQKYLQMMPLQFYKKLMKTLPAGKANRNTSQQSGAKASCIPCSMNPRRVGARWQELALSGICWKRISGKRCTQISCSCRTERVALLTAARSMARNAMSAIRFWRWGERSGMERQVITQIEWQINHVNSKRWAQREGRGYINTVLWEEFRSKSKQTVTETKRIQEENRLCKTKLSMKRGNETQTAATSGVRSTKECSVAPTPTYCVSWKRISLRFNWTKNWKSLSFNWKKAES